MYRLLSGIADGIRARSSTRPVLQLSAEEFSRLRHIHPERIGAGPFSVSSPLFLAVSNSVFVIEMLALPLLLIRRTRTLTALGLVFFVGAIQAGARELLFGLLMVNLLRVFPPRALNRRLLPLTAACYPILFVAQLAGVAFH